MKEKSLLLSLWKFFLCFLFLGILSASTAALAYEELEELVPIEDATGAYLKGARTIQQNNSVMLFMLDDEDTDAILGEQLSNDLQRKVYQALVKTASLQAYSSSNKLEIQLPETVYFLEGVTSSTNAGDPHYYTNDPNYRQLLRDFAKASHAYVKDHIEEYWISSFSCGITSSDVKNGYITRIRIYPVDYYSGVRGEIESTNMIIKQYAAQVSGDTLYEKVKGIHDCVCQQITYPDTTSPAYYHTIPCAWIDTYGHKGVCEAYAKSFAYLCKLCGIDALTVTGGSNKDSEGNVQATHMWNYVKMDDGKWYLVDCTWDDNKNGTVKYDYFLKGRESTAGNHYPVGCFTSKANMLYDSFAYPSLSYSEYVPATVTPAVDVPVTKIQVDELELCIGKKNKRIIYTPVPANANQGTDVTFESLNPDIASVDKYGRITSNQIGKVTIIVRSKECPDIFGTCTVTVTEHERSVTESTVLQDCTNPGRIYYFCTKNGCNTAFSEEIPADGITHTEGPWEIIKEATCQEEGREIQRCALCRLQIDERAITEKKEHIFEWKVETAATCITTGMEVQICSVCKYRQRTQVIPVNQNAHTTLAWVETRAATCTEKGSEMQTCKDCGAELGSRAITVDPDAHIEGTWQEFKGATCSAAGIEILKCKECGKEIDRRNTAKNPKVHTAGAWTVTKAATCTSQGTEVQKCSGCKTVLKTRTISKKAHKAGSWSVTKAPTCTTAGSKVKKCTVCKRELERQAVNPDTDAHLAGNWKETRAATCIQTGLMVRECQYCHKVLYKKTIAKTKAEVTLNAKSTLLQLNKTSSGLMIVSQDPNDYIVSWTSSAPKIVSVNKKTGAITGKSKGTAVITLLMKSGAKATCRVTVKKTVKTTSLKLEKSTIILEKDKSYQIASIRTPVTAVDTLYYCSSCSKVASVSKNGKVTARKRGTAWITIKTKNGVKVKLKVIVK